MGLLGGGFGWASLKKGSGGLVRRRIQVSFIGELGLEQLVFFFFFNFFLARHHLLLLLFNICSYDI